MAIRLTDNIVYREGLISYRDTIVTELMEKWGVESGNETPRIRIRQNNGWVCNPDSQSAMQRMSLISLFRQRLSGHFHVSVEPVDELFDLPKL
jgi:hypothetical protein